MVDVARVRLGKLSDRVVAEIVEAQIPQADS